MIDWLSDLFKSSLPDVSPVASDEDALRLASAVLMYEVMGADFEHHEDEKAQVSKALQRAYSLSDEETRELSRLAEIEASDAISLHEFVRSINQNCSRGEKRHLVEMLWAVAFADGKLDPYEEGLIRRIADLLYMPHQDFIRSKHAVEQALNAGD